MKRSEMVAILAGYLSTLRVRSNIHPEDYIGQSGEILSVLQEAGMLPPSTKLEFVGVNDNAWDKE